MKVVVSRPIAHWCPFVDELDLGSIEVEFDGDAPELHAFRSFLDGFVERKLTHEALTEEVAAEYPGATVTTRWTTAGFDVEVSCAVPRD